MVPVAKLEEIALSGLAYIRSFPDVAEAEVFVSSISHLLTRINFTSSIPCNGIEEPKSTLSYGIGVQAVFKDGDKKKIGFGSQTADISIDGVKEAVEKARLSAVDDPDFHSLPTPSGSPVMNPDYHDPELMNLGDEGLVGLGRERMTIASTTGIIACDEAASASAFITTMIESDNAKGSGYEVGMRLNEFVPENAGRSAAMSAIKSRHGIRVPSGKYKLILGAQPVADLRRYRVLRARTLAVVDAASSAFAVK